MGCRKLTLSVLACAIAACGGPNQQEETASAVPTLESKPKAVAAPSKGSIMRPSVVEEAKTAEAAPPQAPEPIRLTIGFPDGGTELDETARAAIDAFLTDPRFATMAPITLRGHSDSRGGDQANLRTSRLRAESVRDYLVEKGVDEERVTVVALGEHRPVAPNAEIDGSDSEEGRRRNRRVEVEVGPPARRAQAIGASQAPAPGRQSS